jgi:hypothetical protein
MCLGRKTGVDKESDVRLEQVEYIGNMNQL